MMLTDTHTHLYLSEFDSDGGGEAAVRRAIEAGVERMLMPCVDESSIDPMVRLADLFPDNISLAIGLHPTEVHDGWKPVVHDMMGRIDRNPARYVAIGEVGIDLYWDKSMKKRQMEAFEFQALEAERRNLPLIIHCREALDETLEVLQITNDVQTVFHSFGGTTADIERIRKQQNNAWFGINGIVTFKNSTLKDSLPAIGLDRLLLETDSPYLSPVPFRGRRNESANLVHTAKFIANCFGVQIEEIARITSSNAEGLFKFTKHSNQSCSIS